MRNRLLLQRFTPLCASAQTVLVVEPQAGECALFDPLPDAALLDGIEDTIRLNRLSLSWVLFTAGSVDGFRAGQQLQRRMVATRLGIGTLAQRAMHNCAAATGAQDLLPERLFEEEERVQIGSCFASVQHVTDGERIRSGYVFEDFALFGCAPKTARLLRERPFAPCPLRKALQPEVAAA
ncbi:MAG: hypothetical protein AAGG11_04825 [Pseudomonadota bacterium]